MQKTLNATSLLGALIAPLAIIISLSAFITLRALQLPAMGWLLVIVGYALSLLWLYAAIMNSYNTSYDDTHIYLKGYFKSKTIPLSKVVRVQLTNDHATVMGFKTWKYRIVFHPDTNIEEQYFWDVLGGKKADEFAAVLKAQNGNAQVIYHS